MPPENHPSTRAFPRGPRPRPQGPAPCRRSSALSEGHATHQSPDHGLDRTRRRIASPPGLRFGARRGDPGHCLLGPHRPSGAPPDGCANPARVSGRTACSTAIFRPPASSAGACGSSLSSPPGLARPAPATPREPRRPPLRRRPGAGGSRRLDPDAPARRPLRARAGPRRASSDRAQPPPHHAGWLGRRGGHAATRDASPVAAPERPAVGSRPDLPAEGPRGWHRAGRCLDKNGLAIPSRTHSCRHTNTTSRPRSDAVVSAHAVEAPAVSRPSDWPGRILGRQQDGLTGGWVGERVSPRRPPYHWNDSAAGRSPRARPDHPPRKTAARSAWTRSGTSSRRRFRARPAILSRPGYCRPVRRLAVDSQLPSLSSLPHGTSSRNLS